MAKRKPGPPGYSEKEKDAIIAHVLTEVACGRAVRRIIAEDEGMPAQSQFWKWHFESETVQEQLARARQSGIEARMDEAAAIAEQPMLGEIVTIEGEKRTVRTEDMLGHRKLLVETIHKQAQMLKPKTYGPKLDLTTDGKALGLSDAMRAAEKRLGGG